jgi:hypothetical protein
VDEKCLIQNVIKKDSGAGKGFLMGRKMPIRMKIDKHRDISYAALSFQ